MYHFQGALKRNSYMPVTLKDVARLANVTPPVVSRVLHNKSTSVRVSEATAERVRKAAEELGYRVNILARNFRARQTRTIGVLNGLGLTRPIFAHGPRYFASLMDGIVEGAFRHGFSVTLCPQLLGEHPDEGIGDGRFDGLIWYSIAPSPETLEVLRRCAVPIVIVHAHGPDFNNLYPTLICDNAQGLGLAIDHLSGLGHTKIGFAIEGDAMNVESMDRLAGYHFHMERVGLSHDGEDVIDVHHDRKELHNYLANGPKHTAIIVHADGLASEMITTAPKYGLRIPEDLSIIGFDSTGFCDELRPRLTSIRQPLVDLGWKAAEQLIARVGGAVCDPLEMVLPCGLDVRESTSAAKP
jgi:DNA-binding LacI/PurR family transcriptional regulator